MKKKTIFMTMMTVMVISAAAVGCSADKKPVETTTIETTVETTEEAAGTNDKLEELITLGVYKSEEIITDKEHQALFTDENGNDFIANISEDTVSPEELKEGETYAITHTDMMTMSLPGIYPQVSKIEVSETKLELPEDSSQQGVVSDEAVLEESK